MKQNDNMKLAILDLAIQRGLTDVKAGRAIRAEHVFVRLEEKYQMQVKDTST